MWCEGRHECGIWFDPPISFITLFLITRLRHTILSWATLSALTNFVLDNSISPAQYSFNVTSIQSGSGPQGMTETCFSIVASRTDET